MLPHSSGNQEAVLNTLTVDRFREPVNELGVEYTGALRCVGDIL